LDQKLGAKVDILVGHHSVRRVYLNIMASDRRYTAGTLQRPDAGTVAFQQGDITVGEVPSR